MEQLSPQQFIRMRDRRFNIIMAGLLCMLPGGILAVYVFPSLYRVIPVPFYLTVHTIFEFISIVVGAAVFVIAWYNFRQTGNRQELIICLTFLAVGIIDFAHALSYNGMPQFFTANSVNKASTYWIIARLIQAAGVMAAVMVSPVRSGERVHPVRYLVFTAAMVTAALVLIAGDSGFLPQMYRQGAGQTPVKIVLEYTVILIQAVTLVYLYVKKRKDNADRHIMAAMLFGIFSEVAFTLYSSAYDTYNLVGHIYKIGASVCILRGFFLASVVRLYEANRALHEQKQKLAEINAELEKVNQLKTDFLANTNHELRTPLTAIIAFTELLLDEGTGQLNEIQRDYLQEINESGQKLLVEINNLLDMSRLEAGQMRVYAEPVSLDEIVCEVLRQLRPVFAQKRQDVTVSLAENLPHIPMDREKIKKVLINLLANAHKFSPEHGRIFISAALSAGSVVVSVTDNGTGMEEEQAANVFEKFYRVEGSLTRRENGTGLGLTIVRHFVELHGGKVWVTSEPGRGATFSFSLPLKFPHLEVV